MERVDLDVATEFLLIAATLVELKARRLLPGPRRHRARRGAAALRGARPPARPAARVQDVQGRGRGCSTACCAAAAAVVAAHAPGPRSRSGRWRPTRSSGSRSTRCSPPRCAGSRRSRRREVDTDHIAPIRASVRDAVETVLALLPGVGADAASAPSSSACDERLEVIVRFLAVLELYKQGIVDLEQVESFGELIVRRLAAGERVDSTSRRSTTGTTTPVDAPSRPSRRDRGRTSSTRGRERVSESTERRRRRETRRAIEAVRAGRDRAGRAARLLAQLSSCRSTRSRRCATSSRAEYETRGPRLRARAGRRRLPLPDPPRPRAVRRAVRARRPDARGCRARRSRRWRSSPTSSRSRGRRCRRSAA